MTNARRRTIVITATVAGAAAVVQAARDLLWQGPDAWNADFAVLWLVNLGTALLLSAAIVAGYWLVSRHRVGLFAFTIALPFVLLASMMPVYAAVRRGVPAEWAFVCPSDAQAYAAPLAILASLLVLPFASRGERKVTDAK